MNLLNIAWRRSPFGVVATGIGLVATALAAFSDRGKEASEQAKEFQARLRRDLRKRSRGSATFKTICKSQRADRRPSQPGRAELEALQEELTLLTQTRERLASGDLALSLGDVRQIIPSGGALREAQRRAQEFNEAQLESRRLAPNRRAADEAFPLKAPEDFLGDRTRDDAGVIKEFDDRIKELLERIALLDEAFNKPKDGIFEFSEEFRKANQELDEFLVTLERERLLIGKSADDQAKITAAQEAWTKAINAGRVSIVDYFGVVSKAVENETLKQTARDTDALTSKQREGRKALDDLIDAKKRERDAFNQAADARAIEAQVFQFRNVAARSGIELTEEEVAVYREVIVEIQRRSQAEADLNAERRRAESEAERSRVRSERLIQRAQQTIKGLNLELENELEIIKLTGQEREIQRRRQEFFLQAEIIDKETAGQKADEFERQLRAAKGNGSYPRRDARPRNGFHARPVGLH